MIFKSKFIKLASNTEKNTSLFRFIASSLIDTIIACTKKCKFWEGDFDSTSPGIMCFCRIFHAGTVKLKKNWKVKKKGKKKEKTRRKCQVNSKS